MKKIVALFLITSACLAQNQNNIWCFGDSVGINFNGAVPLTFASGMDGRGSCTTIADDNGQLLFYSYTVANATNFETNVFNSQHQLMQNGDTIVGEAWYNELTIIPMPGNDSLYYLFSMGEVDIPTQGMWYSLVDMNANGGLGSVIVKNVRMNNFRNADCVTAIKHGNGRDWWVFSKYSNINATQFNRFYTYLVTPDTIMPPIVQNLNNAADGDVQRIIFNSKGTKMMQINPLGFMCEYDFDRCTAAITNPHLIFPEQTSNYNRLFWSGAYSPNDSLFYISTNRFFGIDTSYLFQFDLTAAIFH